MLAVHLSLMFLVVAVPAGPMTSDQSTVSDGLPEEDSELSNRMYSPAASGLALTSRPSLTVEPLIQPWTISEGNQEKTWPELTVPDAVVLSATVLEKSPP